MDRREALRALGALAVGGLAGCTGGPDPRRVDMVGVSFEPRRVAIDVGRTVEWVNESTVVHTVTAYEDRLPPGAAYFASGGFDSERAARDEMAVGFIDSDETYAHTFETAGEHHYYCIPHEGSGMTGVVDVG